MDASFLSECDQYLSNADLFLFELGLPVFFECGLVCVGGTGMVFGIGAQPMTTSHFLARSVLPP